MQDFGRQHHQLPLDFLRLRPSRQYREPFQPQGATSTLHAHATKASACSCDYLTPVCSQLDADKDVGYQKFIGMFLAGPLPGLFNTIFLLAYFKQCYENWADTLTDRKSVGPGYWVACVFTGLAVPITIADWVVPVPDQPEEDEASKSIMESEASTSAPTPSGVATQDDGSKGFGAPISPVRVDGAMIEVMELRRGSAQHKGGASCV